eukprot:TRINITY_DN10759_c0_g1_i2.p1 TRINITY_DN10759_c0_g1~~TRINITY_DN10759_c0_g1_i2.p1  ORF type:complete len:376 (+),score=73.57 TRINITY_DN10759_c0_g1_i2:87-1130(+)
MAYQARTVYTGAPVPGAPAPVASQAAAYPAAATLSARVPGQPQVIYQSPPVRVQQPVMQPQAIAAGAPVVRSIVLPAGQPVPVAGARPLAPGVPAYTSTTPLPAGARVIRTSQAAPLTSSTRVVATRPSTIGGPAYSQAGDEVKLVEDEKLQNLKELRKVCGLKQIPVNDGLQAFKSAATDNQLSREQFVSAYTELLQARDVAMPRDEVKNAVFDLFDRDANHVVDMMELICGISLLCSGTEDEKIHAVFNVFDENGDGFISMDEMYKFLTSVFKVVLTPVVMNAMNSMGVSVESAEDLASVTSLECFKTADLNHDGKLSVEEFKTWFYAPRNDPSFLLSPVQKLLQ